MMGLFKFIHHVWEGQMTLSTFVKYLLSMLLELASIKENLQRGFR